MNIHEEHRLFVLRDSYDDTVMRLDLKPEKGFATLSFAEKVEDTPKYILPFKSKRDLQNLARLMNQAMWVLARSQ